MKDSADIKKMNKDKIRRILWKGGQYTKQGIATKTGLSVATCNTLLNEMNKDGEVIGVKHRLQEVGRSTVFYEIDESFESILCVSFEVVQNKRMLECMIISSLGNILEHWKTYHQYLEFSVIVDCIARVIEKFENISRIMIGTPSIAEHGIICHCDIQELENESVVKKLEEQFQIPVYMENDMHFKVYGYYKLHCEQEDIVTLANFPTHIMPGTASVHAGMIIKGHNQFAGMVGFLPYGMSIQQMLLQLEPSSCLPIITKAAASIIAIINPTIIVFTGDLLSEKNICVIQEECKKVIPKEYLPKFIYEKDISSSYLTGMYQKALDLKGEFVI